MLRELYIRNFALIDELQIQLQPGLNILTGETGAGKSIIIDALDLLLGGRASANFIRTGQKQAFIQATFDLGKKSYLNNLLTEMGLKTDPEQIILSREITTSGNNRLRINGQFATRNMVKDLSQYLLDIHGQNEHQTLLKRHEHLRLLDEYGGEENEKLIKETQKYYFALKDLQQEMKTLQQNEHEKNQRLELLNYQIAEIDQAKLEIGEEEALIARRKILINAEKLFQNTSIVDQLLAGDGFEASGALEIVGQLLKKLEEMQQIDANLETIRLMIESAYYQLEEASFSVGSYANQLEFDQDELMEIEERLSLLSQLKRKYGQNIKEIISYREEIARELSSLTQSEERLEALAVELVEIKKQYLQTAINLSERRKAVGLRFAWKVMREMGELSMPNAKFVVRQEWQEAGPNTEGIEIADLRYHYGAEGLDQTEFLITPNPGEPLKPLIKIASGGEISRIMLAIMCVTLGLGQVDAVIFDEVDSGVGGEAAQKVAEKLALIAKDKQVICITHLPQIAAMADTQYHIYKEIRDQRTYSNVRRLDEEQRIEELARMYGGTEVASAKEHASAMLRAARKKKVEL